MNDTNHQCLIEIEAYWSGRMCELVTDDRIEDSDALYSEFCINGEEPDEWTFINDLTNVY